MKPDVYETTLIQPILNSKTISQARARARSARAKLARHEKATRMYIGDAALVFDRINRAELQAIHSVVSREQTYGKSR